MNYQMKILYPCRACGISTVQVKLSNGNYLCWCGCENAAREEVEQS